MFGVHETKGAERGWEKYCLGGLPSHVQQIVNREAVEDKAYCWEIRWEYLKGNRKVWDSFPLELVGNAGTETITWSVAVLARRC
jgi:hypothetical protein